MTKEKIILNDSSAQNYEFDDLKQAVTKIMTVSENQFEEIKKEKWYTRVFDMVTFSQKKNKRVAEQIGNLAQAQQVLMEILIMLSDTDNRVTELVTDNAESIKKLQENDTYLLKKVIRLEHKLFRIQEVDDIANLSKNGKCILCGCLYYLSEQFEDNSVSQQNYAEVVIKYIQTDAEVENIFEAIQACSEGERKMILTCCMEYIFLYKNEMSIPDNLNQFIDEFDFGRKTIESVSSRIQGVFKLRGNAGFINRYSIDETEDIDESFVEFDDMDFGDSQEEDVFQETEEPVMEDLYISSILNINKNEKVTYTYKNVHISAFIKCAGTLEFENCVIYYNESDASDEIYLSDNASLRFYGCLIVCRGLDEEYFIQQENYSGKVEIVFEECVFNDCAYFLNISDFRKIVLHKCEMHNCGCYFIQCFGGDKSSSCIISECLILEDEPMDFMKKNEYSDYLIRLSLNNEVKGEIENCKIERVSYSIFKIRYYFSLESVHVENCTFTNVERCIIMYGGKVEKCMFKNCKICISMGFSPKESEIRDCVFEKCTNVLFDIERSKVLRCRFLNCYNRLIDGGYFGGNQIELCEFINVSNVSLKNNFCDPHISLKRAIRGASSNSIKNCIFNGVNLCDNFLIAPVQSSHSDGEVIYIEKCNFMNCATRRHDGVIIKKWIEYDFLLLKNQIQTVVSVRDCKGLDKVKKGGTAPILPLEIKTQNQEGEKIGATISKMAAHNVALGLVGALGGPLAGVAVAAGANAAKSLKTAKNDKDTSEKNDKDTLENNEMKESGYFGYFGNLEDLVAHEELFNDIFGTKPK